MRKKFRRKIAFVVMAGMLAVSGCGSQATLNVKKDNTTVESTTETVDTDLNTGNNDDDDKVDNSPQQDNRGAKYSGKTVEVEQTQSIRIKLDYVPRDKSIVLYEAFPVYEDPEMKNRVNAIQYDWDDDTNEVVITPSGQGILSVMSFSDEDKDLSGKPFMTDSKTKSWGYIDKLYLGNTLNDDGDPLSEVELTVIDVKQEIPQAPNVIYTETEDGCARLLWDPVDGATEYLICRGEKDPQFGYDSMSLVGRSKTTEWICLPEGIDEESYGKFDEESIYCMNARFNVAVLSDDDKAANPDSYTGFVDDYDVNDFYCVIAINDKGASAVSNMMNAYSYSHLLPYTHAFNANQAEVDFIYDKVKDLPATVSITMCDGSTASKVIDYDFENIVWENDGFYVKATASNTMLVDKMYISNADKTTLDEEFKAITERQEKLKKKGGNINQRISTDDQPTDPTPDPKPDPTTEDTTTEDATTEDTTSEDVTTEDVTTEDVTTEDTTTEEPTTEVNNTPTTDTKIYGNTELSKYLAQHMLNTETQIDVSAYNESADSNVVFDAVFEAEYQNPLILGIKGISMDTRNKVVYIEYDYDRATTEKKQQEIQAKVNEIVAGIIKDGMSDYEKGLAINEYLCANAEYDFAALENAKANDFKFVDPSFNDSFTSYGILVNKVGVCAGYAGSYKLLADACGLETIVVTGYLEGGVAHAWNKVKIDGNWYAVDSTNNDNELIPNALLNLSDRDSYETLVQDERFVIDGYINNYIAPSSEKDYYKMTGKFYERDQIVDAIAAELNAGNEAILRTDYTLSDDDFQEILNESAQKAQMDVQGIDWVGVVHIRKAQ